MIETLHESFQWSAYSIPVAIVSVMIMLIGIFILSQAPRARANQSFFLICSCVNAWLYGISLMAAAKDPDLSLIFYRVITFLGVSFVSPSVYFFSTIWLNIYERRKKWVAAFFAGSAVFYVTGLFSEASFEGVYKYYWGHYPNYGWLNIIFIGYFFSIFFAAFYNFAQAYLRELPGIRKTQIKLIAIAFVISLTGSVDYIPKLAYIPVYPFGYLSVGIWILMVAYSIVKYKVMDIQTVIHKTLMWFAASSIFVAPVILLFLATKDWLLAADRTIFAAFVSVAFILFALYTRHIQPRIDHWFQRRQWDLMRALEKFTDELVQLKDLEEVEGHIVNTIKKIFYVHDASLLARTKDAALDVPEGFLNWLEAHDQVVVGEYLAIDPRFEEIATHVKDYFFRTRAVIAVPLVVNRKLIGILNIGSKQNLQPFRSSDINFLSDFRRSAAIALSNSLHLIAMQENLRRWNEELEKKVVERTQQLQDTQAQLVQAEKLATIGTLSGGIAHEINNPLTAVLTNAQILKMDALTEDIESISLIEEGAKRCQVIIQNLLKYARKSEIDSPMKDVHLHDVVKNVCNLLAYQFKQENVEVALALEEVPLIRGISNELEQVVTNLILNARDAIKSANRQGVIMVRSFVSERGAVRLEVRDNGTGIKEENMRKVFDPFFTTKDVGKGTGLGLSVSYSIVQKHEGQISISSQPGHGTTVSIEFPAAEKVITRHPDSRHSRMPLGGNQIPA